MTSPTTASVRRACNAEEITKAVLPGVIGDAVAAGSGPMTIQALIDLCVRMQPVLAAEKRDSTLCVTPLISELVVDGKVVHLKLVNGRFGAAYVRVSDERQRSARSVVQKVAEGQDQSRRRRGGRTASTPDGYSEEEQLNRQIRYYLGKGMAFKIYSDAGITGEFPTNDPHLIKRLLVGKANRYRKIFTQTMLDETSVQKRTPEEIKAMREYLENRCERIQQGWLSETAAEESTELGTRAKLRLRGRPRSQTFFRQGLTQMWQDIETDLVHTTAVSDRSRLCRSADLETEFLQLIALHKVRLHGCIEDLSTLDVGDPIKKGMSFLIASVNEYRLEEIAGHCLRGVLQLLEGGNPSGVLAWWLERDDAGRAALIDEYIEVVERIVNLAVSGLGEGAITSRLHEAEVRVDGKSLTKAQIRYVLNSDAVLGQQKFFGIMWNVFPPVIAAEKMEQLRALRDGRAKTMANLHDPRTWAEHLFTGVFRCWCGKPLIYTHTTKDRQRTGSTGYYGCKAAHKTADGGPEHSWLSEHKVKAFFDSLLMHHPDIISSALASGNDHLRRQEAECAVAEGQLRAAQQAFQIREDKARATVEKSMAAIISPASPGFTDAVTAAVNAMLDVERQELHALEQRLMRLGLQQTGATQAKTVLATLGEAGQWSDLDTFPKNRILRALFERIDVYPIGRRGQPTLGGYIDIKVAGVETHLPPVRLRRLNRKSVDLPTVGQWIDDMLSVETIPAKTFPQVALPVDPATTQLPDEQPDRLIN